jgi:hypothetical protein
VVAQMTSNHATKYIDYQDSNITLFFLSFYLCVLRVLCGWRLLIARQATAAGTATLSFSLQGCSDGRMLG